MDSRADGAPKTGAPSPEAQTSDPANAPLAIPGPAPTSTPAASTSGPLSPHTPDAAPTPWRNPRFRWFALGNALNNVGEGMYDVALPLLVYGLTGSVVIMGVTAAVLPATLLLGPILGAVADRRGSNLLVAAGLTTQLVASTVLSVLILVGGLGPAVLVVLVVVLQIGGATYRVGWMTSVPELFPETPVRARGTLSSLFVATTIIGPLLVGVLLARVGYVGLLWLNTLSFLAPVAVFLAGIRPAPKVRTHTPDGGFVVDGLRVGFDAMWNHATLRRLTLVMLPFDLVESAAIPTLALFHMRDTLSIPASTVASLFAAMNVAALVGALFVSERRVFRPTRLVAAIIVVSAGALATAASPAVLVAGAAIVILMLLSGAASSLQSMVVVEFVPQEVFGRASGVLRLIHGVPSVLGPLAVAALVPLVGTSGSFGVLAGVALIGALGFMLIGKSEASGVTRESRVQA